MYCKLDRAMVDRQWIQMGILASASFGHLGISDHAPCILTFLKDSPPAQKSLKFSDAWIKHPHFLDIVKEVWSTEIEGCPMFILVQKWKKLKYRLKQFHREYFSNMDARKQVINEKLSLVQQAILAHP